MTTELLDRDVAEMARNVLRELADYEEKTPTRAGEGKGARQPTPVVAAQDKPTEKSSERPSQE